MKNLGVVPILASVELLLTVLAIPLLIVGGALVLTVGCYAMLAVYYVAISPFVGTYWLIKRLITARANRAAA